MLGANIIDFQKLKEEDVFRTKEGKLYLKALKLAVDAGAISSLVLQKKLGLDYKSACQMLNWMIEHQLVKDDSGKDSLKTTLISESQFEDFRQLLGYSLKTKREKQSTVDEALYKACLRLAIRQNTISEGRIREAFAICNVRAKAVMDRMEQDGYIKYVLQREEGDFKFLWNKYKILITKEKFKELYGEEI